MILHLLLGTAGNLIIIIYYGFKDKSKRVFTLYLVHLAITDLVASILTPIYYFPYDLTGYWYYGSFLCKYTIFVGSGVTIYSSCWILFGILYERYRSIVFPLEKKMTRMKIHLFCTGAWVVSITFHAPYFIATFHEETEDSGHYKCVNKIMTHFPRYIPVIYFIVRLVVQAILPVSLMVFFYIKIQAALMKSNEIAIKTRNASTALKRSNAILKALRLALIVFAVTAILNNSSHVFRAVTFLYFPSTWGKIGSIKSFVELLIRALAVNNVANCFIYAGTMKDFKKYAVNFLKCKRLRTVKAEPNGEARQMAEVAGGSGNNVSNQKANRSTESGDAITKVYESQNKQNKEGGKQLDFNRIVQIIP